MYKYKFKAVIFDLDGVITQTAQVHNSAWKKMFDSFLKEHAKNTNTEFVEFSNQDYLKYVDGKPRYEGVKSFLKSRNIDLEMGTPDDSPEIISICGLGNKKNEMFNQVLEQDGVKTYESTVDFMKRLTQCGIPIGVASSSKNCKAVLKAANLTHYVLTRVDGVVSAEIGLNGKPAPDIFLKAAENLNVNPKDTIVVEDASSGVEAGRNGGFGLVIGLARENNHSQLWQHGADMVANDMAEISDDRINQWFETGAEKDQWQISYHDYNTSNEKSREAMLTVGNGYMGIRGCMVEQAEDKFNYPATYIAGLYNTLPTRIADRDIYNEDFVRIPDGLNVFFKIDDNPVFNLHDSKILEINRTLKFKEGVLYKNMLVETPENSVLDISSKKFASMDNPHLAAISYTITPTNSKNTITFISKLDGNIINAGVERYKSLNQKHIKAEFVDCNEEKNTISIQTKTTQSGISIAQTVKHNFLLDGKPINIQPKILKKDGEIIAEYTIQVEQNSQIIIQKIMAVATSKHDDQKEPMQFVNNLIDTVSFNELLQQSVSQWEKLWQKLDVKVVYNRFTQKLLRLHIYHLLSSMSPHNVNFDASITARGLHGEAYRGHIFWDEIFILPFYTLKLPEISKAMLMYRYRRLDAARKYAKQHGYKGAMFPWQSGSDGTEQTQIIHLNPLNGQWGDDNSSLQRHVSIAIAFNVWEYFHVTNDMDFLLNYGLEMFLEICRFWESKTEWNEVRNRYDIKKVMGPDEFHEKYPDAETGGLNNNAYTNIMVAWLFDKAQNLINNKGDKIDEALNRINFTKDEIRKWDEIKTKLFLDIDKDGIIAQYEGYFDLKEVNLDEYKQKYGNVYRMDRILKAEGKSPDDYKVAKQADFLMVFYLLEKDEVDEILLKMNYSLPADYFDKNLNYYLARTSHGSTLSRIVHAKLLAKTNMKLSWKLYQEALSSDFIDIQGGTTAEGIHTGVMGGTIMTALNTYAGLNYHKNEPVVKPNMPERWDEINFSINFRNKLIEFNVKK